MSDNLTHEAIKMAAEGRGECIECTPAETCEWHEGYEQGLREMALSCQAMLAKETVR